MDASTVEQTQQLHLQDQPAPSQIQVKDIQTQPPQNQDIQCQSQPQIQSQQHFQQTIFQYPPKSTNNLQQQQSPNKWAQRPNLQQHSPQQNHQNHNNHNNHHQNLQNNVNNSNNHHSNNQNYHNNNHTHNQNQQQNQQRQKQAAWAATLLASEPGDVSFFDDLDPFNPSNRVSGYVCKKTDKMMIMWVNAPLQKPMILDASPAPAHAFTNNAFVPATPHNCKKYFISYKWNGVHVTVYKYRDQEGNLFISARPRGFAFLRDTEHVKYMSIFSECLSKLEPPVSLPLKMENLPQIFFPLNFEVQSITCELFGADMPHLIKYPFDVRLKTLYYTHQEGGSISPISEVEEGLVVTPTDSEEEIAQSLATAVEAGVGLYCGPIDINDTNPAVLENLCRMLTLKARQMNETHRKNSNLPDSARNFDNFLVEGWVLHLLDENGMAVDRMFLLQPEDIQQTHWTSFDAAAQLKTLLALRDLRLKGKAGVAQVSPGDLKKELGLSHYQWVKWGRDIMGLIEGIPPPLDVGLRPKNAQRMVLLVGIPGSGKSTFSRQLVGKGWERCNQDELGTRKAVESSVSNHLRDRKNVIVDRCNFDIVQRHTWVKLASMFGVKWITCIILRTDPEVCKQRVSVREGHQTIPTGEQGFAIIDKFKDLWVEPHLAEGFCEILEIRSDLEMENNVQKLVIHHLENQVENMSSTLQQLQKKIKEIERERKEGREGDRREVGETEKKEPTGWREVEKGRRDRKEGDRRDGERRQGERGERVDGERKETERKDVERKQIESERKEGERKESADQILPDVSIQSEI